MNATTLREVDSSCRRQRSKSQQCYPPKGHTRERNLDEPLPVKRNTSNWKPGSYESKTEDEPEESMICQYHAAVTLQRDDSTFLHFPLPCGLYATV